MSDDQAPEEQIGSEPEDTSAVEPQMGSESDDSSVGEERIEAESSVEVMGELPTEGETAAEGMSDLPAEGETTTEAVVSSGVPEAKGESRVGRFLKRALRWAVLLLFIFTLGVLAMQFVRVQPLREDISGLSQSLTEAETARAELQEEVDRLEGVDAENDELSTALLAAEAKLALLDILVDVTRAQLALAQEDPVRVAAALQGTGEKLTALRDLLDSSDSAELEALRERLVLVLSEVDSDPFAAERDMEILANTLLELERELSGQ
jgi:cell division protein FtsB